jgi:hypothetical protein
MSSVVVYGYWTYSMRGPIRPAYTTHNSATANQIGKQDTIITQDIKKTTLYHRAFKSKPKELGEFSVPIFAWAGPGTTSWTRDERGKLGLSHPSIV